MLEWNLFGAPCILAVYFSTLKDVNPTHDNVLSMPIPLGVCIIVAIHCMWHFLPNTRIYHFINLCHISISLILEISIFLILCQGIGKRGSKEHNIPTEYVYLPLLTVVLILTNRDVSSHKCVESHWAFQVATLVPFVLIISMYPCNSHLHNMSYPGNSLEIYPLYVLLVSIYAIPTHDRMASKTRNADLVASALSKSLVLIIGISCMSSVSGPDM
jgi:hypothetical protein